MKQLIKFYKCKQNENVVDKFDIAELSDSQNSPLGANSGEGSFDKHLPVISRVEDEYFVTVGEVPHPMTKQHYIEWVAQVKDNRINKVYFYPEQMAEARFPYIPNCVFYAYCNLHGLYVSEEVK